MGSGLARRPAGGSVPPLETIFQRNRGRESRVPTDVIERLWERIEPPTWAECHGLVLDGDV